MYHLDANALIDLHKAGVSQKVIAYMVNTANPVVAQAPPPPPAETMVVAPGPDYVWVDGEWVWNGGTWVWIGGRWALPPYRACGLGGGALGAWALRLASSGWSLAVSAGNCPIAE